MAKTEVKDNGISETDQALRDILQVKSPDEIVKFMNLMLYAEFGTGKTYFGGTAALDPRLRPLLIFDVEGGMMTLRGFPGVDVVPVRSMSVLEEKFNKLFYSIRKDENGEDSIYYKTVMIDSGTELADLDMRFVMKAAYQRNPEKVDIDVPSPREYGIVRNHMRLIMRGFKDLPCHFIMTAGLGIDKPQPPEQRPDKYFPGFQGKLARELPGLMDVVGYYRARTQNGVINRVLQVQGTDRVAAKDRTKVLGQTIENPTLSTIWDIVEGVKLQPDDTSFDAPTTEGEE